MLYEYKCDSCEETFARVLPMERRKDPLGEPCPSCAEEESVYRVYSISGSIDSELLKADKRMESSGVQSALERIRDHVNPNMKWKG